MEIFFSIPILLVFSAFFGVTMKMADLFNEHGLKWFKGDGILFGILFGVLGGSYTKYAPFDKFMASIIVSKRFKV